MPWGQRRHRFTKDGAKIAVPSRDTECHVRRGRDEYADRAAVDGPATIVAAAACPKVGYCAIASHIRA